MHQLQVLFCTAFTREEGGGEPNACSGKSLHLLETVILTFLAPEHEVRSSLTEVYAMSQNIGGKIQVPINKTFRFWNIKKYRER